MKRQLRCNYNDLAVLGEAALQVFQISIAAAAPQLICSIVLICSIEVRRRGLNAATTHISSNVMQLESTQRSRARASDNPQMYPAVARAKQASAFAQQGSSSATLIVFLYQS
jgi:hypothetical protein